MKKIRVLTMVLALLFSVYMLCGCKGSSNSGNSNIKEVATFDNLGPAQFDINGSGHMAWTAEAPGEARVYLYQNGASVGISAAGTYGDTPRISNDGRIVWLP